MKQNGHCKTKIAQKKVDSLDKVLVDQQFDPLLVKLFNQPENLAHTEICKDLIYEEDADTQD